MRPRYVAWRFVHPDLDGGGRAPGLQAAPTGRLATVAEDASVRQAVLLLLTTSPGERVMRPDYGCNLRSLLFSPNDDTTAGLAIHYVRQALQRWEPRIDVIAVDASADPDNPSRLDIMLDYRVRATGWTERLTIPVDLTTDAP
jgi:hypothetical protein